MWNGVRDLKKCGFGSKYERIFKFFGFSSGQPIRTVRFKCIIVSRSLVVKQINPFLFEH